MDSTEITKHLDNFKLVEPNLFVNSDRKVMLFFISLSSENFQASSEKNWLIEQQRRYADYTMLQIIEEEWLNKRDIVLSRIHNATKQIGHRIFARACELREVSPKDARIFFNENHLQGNGRGASKCYGLYFQDKLVSCASVGKARFNPVIKNELIRFASRKNLIVVGGASKLISAIKRDTVGGLISYANNRFGKGNVYLKCGFKQIDDSSPCYWYYKHSNPNKIYHRSAFQKHKLSKLLENFDDSATELVNMQRNGWSRVFDAGNGVYVLE